MLKKIRQRPIIHGLFGSFILLIPAFLLMCDRDTDEVSSALRMVNGSIPGADHPASSSAVALVDKNSQDHFCSGTVVAENLIVTAAHCVFDKRPQDFQILFGLETKKDSAVRRDPEALETFKKFQKFESNFDIAWVRFAGGLPPGYRPVEIWHQPDALTPQTPLTIAGYGRTASQCPFDDPTCQGGKLLYVDTHVREFVNHGRLFNLIVIGPRPDHGPCFGDSGGPAYVQRNGQWYLAGDFMGWDRILVPEQLETICDTGEAIYNFVGDFVEWMENSSGVQLTYDASVNPRLPVGELETLSDEPTDFQGWCLYNNHEDPSWFTVQRLIRIVSDYRIQSGDVAGAREIFESCEIAEVWLRKMLTEQRKLDIGGFDPSTFIDSARLEDIRPLRVLADMGVEEITLSDHAIQDLSPLEAFSGLKRLTIIDNVVAERQPRRAATPLHLAAFPLLEHLRLQNPGAPLDFSGLSRLKNLKVLDLAYLDLPVLPDFTNVKLQELRLDTLKMQEAIDLAPLTQVQTLFLNRVALRNFPERWSELESLDLLEVTGLTALPGDAPRMKRIFVYDSDLQGDVKAGNWPVVEEASIFANAALTGVTLPFPLPKTHYLEIADNSKMNEITLPTLPSLENLSLSNNALTTLPDLSQLTELTRLNLENNQLESIQGLAGLPGLEYLDLSDNPLSNLEGLADLPALKRIVLQNGKGGGLKNLQGMRNLPSLIEINLTRNSLTSVQDLLPFTSLKVVILNDNLIEDIAPLKALPKLEYLEVINNPLKEQVCPIPNKPTACRFEWLNFSQNGPIIFPNSARAQGTEEPVSVR
ncbi:leucine-rich repeat domain-containing protein [Oligoflexus tunisiensis]|uniref:leucine-rich repeat domain-containing protein n=1 Tax=Oligoflexus tunisiensis TaxID=708132 RepID=UPI00159F2E13|nr:leucine-rich repeat domain-containing protein [Oligoflexus tunisiensis]